MKTQTDKLQQNENEMIDRALQDTEESENALFSSASVASDSPNITTPRVQLWSQSGTMRGLISSELALQLVKDGKHFVISCQAIGEV